MDSPLPSLPPDPTTQTDATSSFRLDISLSIGYQRKRATLAGKWEGALTSLLLLIGGIVVVLWFLYFLTGLRVL